MYARMNADKVRQLRTRHGMSRKDLADAAGISPETARNAERRAPVRYSTVRKVASVFGLEPQDIGRPIHWSAHRSARPRLYLVS